MRSLVPKLFLSALLTFGPSGCRSPTTFPVRGLLFTGANCVPTGTEVRVRLLSRLRPGITRAGDVWTGLVEHAVRGATADVVIPALALVAGHVEAIPNGRNPTFQLTLDWVETPQGKLPVHGWAVANQSSEIIVRATLIAPAPGTPGRAALRSPVCPSFVEVPAGSVFVVRLDQVLDQERAKPGARFATVMLTPLYSQRGDLVVRVGADVAAEVRRVDRGVSPTFAFRSIETLLGTAPLVAAVERGAEEAIRLPLPIGTEVKLKLTAPLRLPLPGSIAVL